MTEEVHAMEDGESHQYPDPASPQQSAYPLLSNSNRRSHERSNGHPRASRDEDHSFGYGASSSASFFNLPESAVVGANEYLKTAQVFHAKHGSPGRDQQFTLQAMNDLAAATGDDNPLAKGSATAINKLYVRPRRSVKGRDRSWDAAFVLGAIEPDTGDIQPAEKSPDDVSSEVIPKTSERGRGRGRGRRYRGWKWALRGTAHGSQPKEQSSRGEKRKRGASSERGKVGRPRGSGRGRGRGRARLIRGTNRLEPGAEFRTLQSAAYTAYMDGNLDKALELAQDAVAAFPEEIAAHSLISEIYKHRGQHAEALFALKEGAKQRRDASLWLVCAANILEAAGDQPSKEVRQEAIECYTQALACDSNNQEARVERLWLHVELRDWTNAERDCRAALKAEPLDLDIVRTFAEVAIKAHGPDTWRRDDAMKAYTTAFDHYTSQPDCDDVEADTLWSHLNVLLDLMDQRAAPIDSISATKRYARSILGRREETFWDAWADDDREFDTDNDRRGYVGEFQQGKASRDRAKYGDGLPIEIRMKLGFFRIGSALAERRTPEQREADHREATKHLSHVFQLRDQIDLYCVDLWTVADRLNIAGWSNEALMFYEPCMSTPEQLGPMFWSSAANCYHRLGIWDKAEQCYERVLRAQRSNINAMAGLAAVYEKIGRLDQARALAGQVIALGHYGEHMRRLAGPRHAPPTPSNAALLRAAKQGGGTVQGRNIQPIAPKPAVDGHSPATAVALVRDKRPGPGRPADMEVARFTEEQRARILHHYSSLVQDWPATDSPSDPTKLETWIQHANSLCKEFKNMRIFYTKARFTGYGKTEQQDKDLVAEMAAMRARIGSIGTDIDAEKDETAPREFHSIPFAEWHRLFITLGLLYARMGMKEESYDLLDAALNANVFHFNKTFHSISTNAKTHAALLFNDDETLTHIARDYIMASEGVSGDAYQFFAAVHNMCYASTDFRSGPTQKFFHRQVKALDWPHLPPNLRRFTEHSGNGIDTIAHKVARIEKTGFTNHQLNTGLLLTYGHMIGHSIHGHGALAYYFRALALQPDNVGANLMIAVQFLQNAMKRGAQHKQYEVTLGLAFLYRYYELRKASGKASHLQEAEYNVGRCWHMLGLTHLAVDPYEKALGLSGAVRQEHLQRIEEEGEQATKDDDAEDFAMEAALALREIFALAGNDVAALDITEKWLVI